MKILVLGFLTLMSYSDIKKRSINIVTVGFFLVLALILSCCGFNLYEIKPQSIIAGMSLGLIVFVISRVTGGEIGEGDAYIILALGIMLGFIKLVFVVMTAFVLSAISIPFLLNNEEIELRGSLPFVPYMLISYVICLFGII